MDTLGNSYLKSLAEQNHMEACQKLYEVQFEFTVSMYNLF